MKILVGQDELQARISQMASEINTYYKNQEWYKNSDQPVVIICVLTGAIFFMADLVRQLTIRIELDFIRTSTYIDGTLLSREPKILTAPSRQLQDTHILILDDILDRGKTLKTVHDTLRWGYPKTMRTAVLLRKPGKAPENVKADFVGFDIPDEFVVGFGLDYGGKYREMPYVAVWSEDESRECEKTTESNKQVCGNRSP